MAKEDLNQKINQILACETEIGKAIIGQREIIRQTLIGILTGGNILLEGVPGLGKTQLVKTISKVLNLSFARIQFTPDLMPGDVIGTNLIIKEDNQNKFQFEAGPIFANLVLADEINRATPKTQSALLEAMQERTVTVGKQTYKLAEPFMVLATQNPIENEGTYPLPEAQLDRFMLKLQVDFPTAIELKEIMNITVNQIKEKQIDTILTGEDILAIREIIKQIPIADAVADYAIQLVIGTHKGEGAPSITNKYLAYGASPRAAQAIYLAAKGRAFLEGRLNVSFEDIKYCAYPALRHRIVPNFEAVSEGISTEEIITGIITSIKDV